MHTVDVKQEINAVSQPMSLTSKQQFYVDTPEFNIPEGEIHSVYPPQGHEERAEALPHVVFNTPSFPWEWRASYIEDAPDYQHRNRVPWLAVLVFTRDELELSPEELELIQKKSQTKKGSQEGLKQTSNLSINLPVSAVKDLQHTASPIRTPESDPDAATDVILLRSGLFKSLFTKYDTHGHPEKTATHPDVRPFRFLAHRRDINTEGMAVAALTATEDDQSSFGVVVCHRTGPVSFKEPTQCIAHLVSIRGVEIMPWPLSAETRFVALSTLHSWTYTCFPPDTPSLKDQFVALGQSSSLLRANVSLGDVPPDTEGIPPAVRNRVLSRLNDGYILARYRSKTGESTACFMRGPFIPVEIPSTIPRPWHKPSTIGSDLQILDQQLGIMDITYSAAWQLGRTIAIADQDFVSRIGQVRKQIYDRGMQYARLDALHEHGTRSRAELIAQLPSLVASLQQLPTSLQLATTDCHARSRRWHRPSIEPVDISYHGRQAASVQAFAKGKKTLKDCFLRAAKEVSSAVGDDPSQPSKIPYNEFNTPFSTDWMALLKWVVDRLFLEGIPPHYLVPDSSALPLESIRFFKIDWRWMDSLLDGALSLSNHTDQDHDEVREAIVAAIDLYRETKIPELRNHVPSIPKYGCYVRSALVTKFVDLKVDVISSDPSTEPSLILLRHKIVSPETMLCLFSQEPSSPAFEGLSFTQPPHQQSFVAASDLDQEVIEMTLKKAYTADHKTDDVTRPIDTVTWKRSSPASDDKVYLWDAVLSPDIPARQLLMESLSSYYLRKVQEKMDKKYFDDDTATSALMASQLGSVCWRLVIMLDGQAEGVPKVEVSRSDVKKSQLVESVLNARALARKIPSAIETTAPSRPSFFYRVSSTDDPTTTTITATRLEQDLIFRINLEPYTAGTYELKSMVIKLPFGEPTTKPPVLMSSYKGSGAEMISNLRFNVMVDTITKDGKATGIDLRMVPRSRRGFVPVTSCSELSFILSGVLLSQVTRRTEVQLSILENYRKQGSWKPATPPDTVILVPGGGPGKLNSVRLS